MAGIGEGLQGYVESTSAAFLRRGLRAIENTGLHEVGSHAWHCAIEEAGSCALLSMAAAEQERK